VPRATRAELGSGQILLLVVSIGFLGAGLYFEGWQPGPAAFGLTACSYLILLAAVIGRLPAAIEGLSEKQLVTAATVVALAFLVMLALNIPSGLPPRRQIYYLMLGATALLLLAGLFRQGNSTRWWIPMVIAIYLVVGGWVIVENPAPRVDVWAWHNEALNALLTGSNPYTISMPNLYGDSRYYAESMVSGDRVMMGFQYPPLNLYLALPGHLLGDYRYSFLVCTALAGGAMARVANGRLGATMMAVWLFLPVTFLVTQMGWTERMVVFCLAVTVAAAARGSRWTFVALGLLLASKQYVVLLAPLIWLLPRSADSRGSRPRLAAKAAAVAVLLTLPFIIWDARAMFYDLLQVQINQPFRRDALSVLAWVANRYGVMLPQWIGVALVVPATFVALRYAPRTVSGFAMAVGFVFFTFFAFSKQAFANYYVFVMGALAVAVAFARPWPASPHLHRSAGSGGAFEDLVGRAGH
jgi:hypothetical protein